MRNEAKMDMKLSVFGVMILAANKYELVLQCNPSALTLWRDIRVLNSMSGPRIPFTLRSTAEEFRAIYPFYNMFNQSLKQFNSLSAKLETADNSDSISALLAPEQRKILELIQKGTHTSWDSDVRLADLSRDMSDAVQQLERRLYEIDSNASEIAMVLRRLKDIQISSPSSNFIQVSNNIRRIISYRSAWNL